VNAPGQAAWRRSGRGADSAHLEGGEASRWSQGRASGPSPSRSCWASRSSLSPRTRSEPAAWLAVVVPARTTTRRRTTSRCTPRRRPMSCRMCPRRPTRSRYRRRSLRRPAWWRFRPDATSCVVTGPTSREPCITPTAWLPFRIDTVPRRSEASPP